MEDITRHKDLINLFLQSNYSVGGFNVNKHVDGYETIKFRVKKVEKEQLNKARNLGYVVHSIEGVLHGRQPDIKFRPIEKED